jgi:hypothetical protein
LAQNSRVVGTARRHLCRIREVAIEHPGEPMRNRAGGRVQVLILLEHLVGRQSEPEQLAADAKELGIRNSDRAVILWLDHPEPDSACHDLRGQLSAFEQGTQLGRLERDAFAVESDQSLSHPEHLVESATVFPRIDELFDGGQGEPLVLEAGDDSQPGHVSGPVVPDATPFGRAGKQAPRLVHAHGGNRHTAFVAEIVDGQLTAHAVQRIAS